MAQNRKQKPMRSPKGRFMFPKLTEPDFGTSKFPDEDGSYNVRLVLDQDSDDAKAFLARLEPLHAAAVEEGTEKFGELPVASRKKLEKKNGGDGVQVNDLFEVLYDKETEEPTGEIAFRFKTKASGTYKKGPKAGKRWNKKLPIYDAKGKLMAKTPDIWGGTVGRVSFTASPYFVSGSGAVGLTLRLEAAQIIDLVSGGARAASDYGFGEEDGYEHDDSAVAGKDEDADDDEFADESGSSEGDDDADEGNF